MAKRQQYVTTIPANSKTQLRTPNRLTAALLALFALIMAQPVLAQSTCAPFQPVQLPDFATTAAPAPTAPWTRTLNATDGINGGVRFSGTGIVHDDDFAPSSATPTLPTTPNTASQTIAGGVTKGSIITIVPGWNNGNSFTGVNGNQMIMTVAYGGVIYATFRTSPWDPTPDLPFPGPVATGTVSASNGATISGSGWNTAFGGTYSITLPAGVPPGGELQFGFSRTENKNFGGITDDIRVASVQIQSPTVCLIKNTTRQSGSKTFGFTTSNLDTDLSTAGAQTNATITTTAALTPVAVDSWAGATGAASGSQPLIITDPALPATITETSSANFKVTAIACTGATAVTDLAANSVTLTDISANTAAVCTFTNARPRVRLAKVLPNGRRGGPDQFVLNIAGNSDGAATIATATTTGSASTPSEIADFVDADHSGTYTLSEGIAAGSTSMLTSYATSFSCTNAASGSSTFLPNGSGTSFTVTPVGADDITCTFSNAIRPSLTLAKVVVNTNGGTQPASAWTLMATGPSSVSGVTGGSSITGTAVDAGSYALSETGPAGYTASLYSCVKNAAAAVAGNIIALANGDTATCTITNTFQPTANLSVTKTNTIASGASDQAADTVTSGTTTTYTIRVSNAGPSTASDVLVKDTPNAQISCPAGNAVTITGSGVPAGSFTVANLTGAGITLGALGTGQTAVLTFQCNIP